MKPLTEGYSVKKVLQKCYLQAGRYWSKFKLNHSFSELVLRRELLITLRCNKFICLLPIACITNQPSVYNYNYIIIYIIVYNVD